MHELTITGLNRIPDPQPNAGGSTVLAWFDARVGGLQLYGCAFVKTAKYGLTVWPPKLDSGPRRSVMIVDDSLRSALTRAAQTAYRALGGTDGEYLRMLDAGGDPDPANPRAANYQAASRRIRAKDTEVPAVDADAGLRRMLGA